MKILIAGAAAALGLTTSALAWTEGFDDWVQGLSQNGWRLVAVSEPLKSALLMGADKTDEAGRRITSVRYEFMGGAGGLAGLVAQDVVDCKAGTITRLKVTGYSANNLGGQTVEQQADANSMSAVPYSYQQEEVHYACGLAVSLKIAAASPDPKKKVDDPNRVTCRSEVVLGSSIPVRRCETRLQAEERRHTDQQALEKVQRERPLNSQ